MVGYHYVIRRNGVVEVGRAESMVGAHVEGWNKESIGICLAGGLDENGKAQNNFTEAQWNALRKLVFDLQVKYRDTEVLGHRDFPGVKKDCPCFDVRTWYKETFE